MGATMASEFLGEHFLLSNDAARRLYFDYARGMPIFDYHCHLPPEQIADNHRFANLTEIWLGDDHYKWRVMRALGVDEVLVTGAADDRAKFRAWAEVVPYTVRNPVYHWTHMELRRPFGIDALLTPANADAIYDRCNELLAGDALRVRGLLEQFDVRAVCTTDDPADDLAAHRRIAADATFSVVVAPAFRPDKAIAAADPAAYNAYLDRLAAAAGIDIAGYDDLLQALEQRHAWFHEQGCRLSDHGLEQIYADSFTAADAAAAFATVRAGTPLDRGELRLLQSALLYELAVMDASRGWTQQYHLGVMRGLNTRLGSVVGPDSGFDTIGDMAQARSLARFLDRLDRGGQLAKTILYNLNPRDNDLMAAMIGTFQDGTVRGKMQFGTAWWFNDQIDGMRAQMAALSNSGVISAFVGMVTDSRSFLSYPRHDYFRRLLCGLFGEDIERGVLPADYPHLGGIVQDICFDNAARYFAVPGVVPTRGAGSNGG
jgi:glucuronate isomerase